ncbi:sensor histidine kinase [Anaeromyxobacter oryzisoli]|uniref:sensor histidine kinase n=1 Tax=Anaeromyxobacter oryzisoli TaxID=2925408 RepID=UPI001F5AB99E|nr:PAS domain-containing sensor histidine kinase [Anaeromyxobacter sp. SG63]
MDPHALRAAYEEERRLREAAERYSEALAAKALQVARVEAVLRQQIAVAREHAALHVKARRAAEEAAAAATRSAAELDAVLAAIPAGIAVFDSELRILRANVAAREVVGIPDPGRDTTASERIQALGLLGADGRPLPREDCPVVRALRGETVAAETYARTPATPGGRPRWVTMSAAPVVEPSGGGSDVVAAVFDVTREHELLEMREDLLRMVSHDLRTPLQAVLTHAHLIRRAADVPPAVAERAEAIVRTSERMGRMLQDLSEMVLLESGHLTLSRVPLDVPAFLREVLERLSAPLPPDRIRLRAAGDAPPVLADPARLERVVVNLLSNALKYSPAGAPVEVSVVAASGDAVEIEVADQGVGIPQEILPRIFDRFYRVSDGRRQPEGLGLGLYIARLLVDAHGGRIAVDSAPGRGSRFVVRLPAAAPAP